VLWILGDLVGLPFLAAQLIHMMREDESDAARIDAELDAQRAQREAPRLPADSQQAQPSAPAASADEADPAAAHEPQEPQLWWETDPRFTSRFKPTS
jgi:hypothetical protein